MPKKPQYVKTVFIKMLGSIKTMNYIVVLITTLLLGCSLARLPQESLHQYKLGTSYEFTNNELRVRLNNTLRCPMRIWIQSNDIQLKTYFNGINPITIEALGDTVLRIQVDSVGVKELRFASRFGDIKEEVKVSKVELPFQKDKKYRLVQGYSSLPTHNTNWSRYAIDFGLAIGDTVCAATSGFVVGVVDGYKYGGIKKEWRDYANCITVYDPATGLYTQYVHLSFKGSFVSVGDKVATGDKIGIAGMTGQTNIEHLHFNCLKPIHSENGLISIPLDSIGSYRISEMERNEMIKK